MRLLGLDVGTRTIGVAVSDEGAVVATPLRTLSRTGGMRDLQAVEDVARELSAGAIVLGLPLEPSGREGDAVRRVRRFGARLAEHLGCQVYFFDERYSTAAAERVLLEADVRRRNRRRVVDKLAASLILQGFLDSPAGARLRAAGEAGR